MRCVRDVFTSEWENCSAAQNNACCQHSGGSRHTSQVFLAARLVSSLWMDWNQSIIQETDLKKHAWLLNRHPHSQTLETGLFLLVTVYTRDEERKCKSFGFSCSKRDFWTICLLSIQCTYLVVKSRILPISTCDTNTTLSECERDFFLQIF